MLMRDFQKGMGDLLSSRATLEDKARVFVRLVSGFLGGAPVSLFLLDREEGAFSLQASSVWRCRQGEVWFDAAATIDALALEEDRVVHLAEEESRPADERRRAEHLVFPLVAHGERAGVLTAERVAVRRVGEGRRQVLAEAVRRFADLLVQELRVGRLSRRLTRLSSLQEVGVTLLSAAGVRELLRSTAFSASFVLEAEAAVVRLLDPRRRQVAVLETHGLEEEHFRDRALALEEQAFQAALGGGGDLLVRDVAADRRFAAFDDAVRDFACRTVADRDGVGGSITVLNKLPGGGVGGGRLGEEDRVLLAQLARYFGGAARTAMVLASRERARGFDPLTGLLSLRAFRSIVTAEIRRAKRFGTRFLLLACEVSPEGGGALQATGGGDAEFYRTVGRRIRGAFREYDHVARAGRGRFVAILPEVRDAMTGASRRVELAVAAEKDRLNRLGAELQVEIAFTQALFPDDGATWEDLARSVGLAA